MDAKNPRINGRLLALGGVVVACAAVVLGSYARALAPAAPGEAMAAAAKGWLGALTPEQRKKATFTLEDKEGVRRALEDG